MVDSSESSAAVAGQQTPPPSHERAHYECVSLQHLSKVRHHPGFFAAVGMQVEACRPSSAGTCSMQPLLLQNISCMAASMGDCSRLTPGTPYTMSHGIRRIFSVVHSVCRA